MTVRRIIYKQDAPGRVAPYPGSPYLPFGAFCMSPRMQGLVNKVCRDTAIIAKLLSPDGPEQPDGDHERGEGDADQTDRRRGEIANAAPAGADTAERRGARGPIRVDGRRSSHAGSRATAD